MPKNSATPSPRSPLLSLSLLTWSFSFLRALPQREPFQKFSKAKAKPSPKRGVGNSFQPAIDVPQLEPLSTCLNPLFDSRETAGKEEQK
jgi:hypothetical protein